LMSGSPVEKIHWQERENDFAKFLPNMQML